MGAKVLIDGEAVGTLPLARPKVVKAGTARDGPHFARARALRGGHLAGAGQKTRVPVKLKAIRSRRWRPRPRRPVHPRAFIQG